MSDANRPALTVVQVAATVPEPVHDTVTSQLRFHFPDVRTVRFEPATVTLEVDREVDGRRVGATVQRLASRFARLTMQIPKRVLHESTGAFDLSVFHEAGRTFVADLRHLAPGTLALSATPVGRGLNVYHRTGAATMAALDAFLATCLARAYGATDIRVPAMISAQVLARAGYFETGFQHLSFVAPVPNEPEPFDELQLYWRGTAEPLQQRLMGYLKAPVNVLNPALCLHCYPLVEGRRIGPGELVAFTVGGSCFREESGNLNNDERLYEFQMREGVIAGSTQRCADVHGQLTDLLILVGRLFDLDFRVESATDIFFNDNAEQRTFSQLVSDDKLELSVHSPALGRRIACASLNKHHAHFAEPFGITESTGDSAATMCVGFGLNRLLLTIAERHDGDLARLADRIENRLEELVPR